VLGVLGGILWWAVTDTATWTVTKGGTTISNDETRLQFGAIVTFVLIGAGICAVLGFAVVFLSEVTWPAIPAVALLSGQAAVLAWLVGGLLGPDEPKRKGPVGTRIDDALTVDAVAPFVAWAVFGVAGLLIGLALIEHEPTDDPH
jgi:hypothetical protein